MHDIQTVRITFAHQPHQPNCNPKHMYQHLMYWLDSYAGHAESAVQFIWHTNLCIPSRTGIRTKRTAIRYDPNRETYHPHNPRDTNNLWPWWPQGLYKRIENLRIRHSDHHQIHPVYLHKKICLHFFNSGFFILGLIFSRISLNVSGSILL